MFSSGDSATVAQSAVILLLLLSSLNALLGLSLLRSCRQAEDSVLSARKDTPGLSTSLNILHHQRWQKPVYVLATRTRCNMSHRRSTEIVAITNEEPVGQLEHRVPKPVRQHRTRQPCYYCQDNQGLRSPRSLTNHGPMWR